VEVGRFILRNALVHTGVEVLPAADVILRDGRIEAVRRPEGGDRGDGDAGTGERLDSIDASGFLLTPGLVNAHTHIYSALARGMPLKAPSPETFPQILERVWWRLDRALNLTDIDLSARLTAVETLRAGVTTLFDHHSSQRSVRGSLSTIARVLAEAGMRSCLCFEVSDREGEAAAAEGIEENRAYLHEVRTGGGAMRRALFGFHAAFTLSPRTLNASVRAARETDAGFHIHLAEDRCDEDGSRRIDPRNLVERLAGEGVLTEKTLCVHGVHLDQRGIERLSASGAWLVHCPQSNMNNAVGAVSLRRMRAAGVRLALGTDGFTSDVKREALVGTLLQNHLMSDPREGSETLPGLLFSSNAALAAECFEPGIGRIEAGAPADLVIWDYRPPTPLTRENFTGHLLFGLVNARARDVFVAGQPLLRDGRLLTLDEEELRRACSAAALSLWKRL